MLNFKLILVMGMFSFVGCASIFRGSSQMIAVNSNVKGATVEVDGNYVGTTPFTGKIKRGKSTLSLKKEGYESKTLMLDSEIETMFWGNIIFGGLFGSSTDYGTGAMYSYSPGTHQIDLEQSETVKPGKK